MAYDLKYQSDFYNYFHTLVSLKIYKRDYGSHATIYVRTSEVTITVNYTDDNTPVIGTGAKVVIRADTTNLTYLEDLLLSYEKEFMCTIEYGGVVVFRGYTLYDLNERQLLPYSAVTIQFTDYLHRTEGEYAGTLKPVGGVSNLMSVVQSILTSSGLEFPLFVNSTLFEDSMNQADTDCFLPQVCVQNSIFYSDSYTYDNVYDMVNKALHSFGAFLYAWEDRWIIERQEDITRDGTWISYNPEDFESEYDSEIPEGVAITSLKQSINKQDGDFEYVEMSQVMEYDTGLHTLILRLRDKLLDTLVFNDWPDPDSIFKTLFYSPAAGTLDYRTWYIHNDFTDLKKGEDKNDINQWIHYTASETFVKGLCYNFAVYFNQDSGNDTVLSIEYSNSTKQSMTDIYRVGQYFILKFDGGTYSNSYLVVTGLITAYDPHGLSTNVGINIITSASMFYGAAYCYNYSITAISGVGDDRTKTFTLSNQIDFTDIVDVRIYNNPNGTYQQYNGSLWDLLGQPEQQSFNITFCSPQYTIHQQPNDIWEFPHMFPDVYLGDITVTVNAEEIDNKITYVLNKDFIKTEEVDLYLFDLKNLNYSNALLEVDGLTRTNLWTSENSPIAIPLYEVFAKCKFRKYGRTIHRLKATILIDQILKPFTIITDDTLLNINAQVITFLLNGYNWDLVKGQYEIDAEEYTEEEVIVEGVTYDSLGEPEDPWGGLGPDAPTGLTLDVLSHLPLHPIGIIWNPVSGGIGGYILQRKPYWSVALNTLVDDWKLVYVGTNTQFVDFLQDYRHTVVTITVSYRVFSYNTQNMSSLPSSEEAVLWNA